MRTLIVAEPGSTHEGDYDTMLRLIQCAADCKVDVFKNQWTSSAETMCARRHAPEYLESYRKLQYPLAWHARLRESCREHGLAYGCTAYIPGDPTALVPFVDYLKISSFETRDEQFVAENLRINYETLARLVKADLGIRKVIMSVGMATSYVAAIPFGKVLPYAILHCCSAYPAALDALNLRAMPLGARPARPGFSDHSRDVRTGAWAVCAGAEVLETHFRLDDCDPANRDYAVSFTPAELAEYVRNVRDCESALGDGVKRVQACEEPMLQHRVLC